MHQKHHGASHAQLLTKYDDNVYCIYIDSLCRLFPDATTIHLIEPIVDHNCQMLHQFHQFLDSQMFYSLELTEIHLICPTFVGVHEANITNEVIQHQWTIQQSNKTTDVIKKLKPRRGSGHAKSHSTPNAMVNDDPFSGKMQQMNKSQLHILSEGDDLLFENDSNLTDVTQNTQNTQITLAPVLIKLRMKSHLKDHKDMNIEFVFNPDESPHQVANDMIQELALPCEYLDAAVDTIHQYIYKQQYTRSRNASSVRMGILIFITYLYYTYRLR
eukprot:957485_1